MKVNKTGVVSDDRPDLGYSMFLGHSNNGSLTSWCGSDFCFGHFCVALIKFYVSCEDG